jgi:hypothetical protein
MCVVNFAISVWNAHSVGKIWTESKYIGGWVRVVEVSGYIMAVVGFTMVYTIIILSIISATKGLGYLSAESSETLLQFIGDLSSLLIATAIIPTGIIITINSHIAFWKRKSLRGGIMAGWNTFATVSNVVNASRAMPSAFGRILSTAKNSRNGGIILLAIIVVALCVLGGYFTASAIVKRSDKQYDLFANVAPAAAAAGGGGSPQGYPQQQAPQQQRPTQEQRQKGMAEREAELRNRSDR